MTEHKHTPDSLADELDRLIQPDGQTAQAASDDPLVQAAIHLANAPRPDLPPDAKARIQSRMLRRARQQSAKTLRPDFTPILRWALVASLALIVMLIPAAQVALASVPGDIFYPLKQTIEQVETNLASSPESRAAVHITHAERRAKEAEILLERGQFDPALISAAYDNLAHAASVVRAETTFDSGLRSVIQLQTAKLTTALSVVLETASQTDSPVAATAVPYLTQAAATHDSGAFLLPETEATTPVPTATPTHTETPVPTFTQTPAATATPELTATFTPTATLDINIVVDGSIEAINGNIIVIYGIEIVFDPNDPLLAVLRVGDIVQVSGHIMETGGTSVTITGVAAEAGDDSIAISEDRQTIWRDSGSCSNPPPPWAPARGWRARCEGGQAPAGGNRSGSVSPGNNRGRGQGQGPPDNPGSGRGRGGGNADDDD
jgi:hypothetical protein